MCKVLLRMMAVVALALNAGCAGPMAKVTYHSGAENLSGYKFVVPRTVVNVSFEAAAPATPSDATPGQKTEAPPKTGAVVKSEAAAPKKPADGAGPKLSLIPVPVIYGTDNSLLPVLTVTDDSGGGVGLTPTTLTSVTYADRYVIASIGTQVTDNRKAAINAAFGVVGSLAKGGVIGFAGAAPEQCNQPLMPPSPFAIDNFESSTIKGFVPGTRCWGYSVEVLHEEDGPDKGFIIAGASQPTSTLTAATRILPLEQSVSWFPYPACRQVKISVFACDPNTKDRCNALDSGPTFVGAVNVSTGKYYRSIALPTKGKITFHPDFCVADVTNDSSGITSSWDLLQQAITDYQSLTQAGKSTSSK
jgi:hypothetical protein